MGIANAKAIERVTDCVVGSLELQSFVGVIAIRKHN